MQVMGGLITNAQFDVGGAGHVLQQWLSDNSAVHSELCQQNSQTYVCYSTVQHYYQKQPRICGQNPVHCLVCHTKILNLESYIELRTLKSHPSYVVRNRSLFVRYCIMYKFFHQNSQSCISVTYKLNPHTPLLCILLLINTDLTIALGLYSTYKPICQVSLISIHVVLSYGAEREIEQIITCFDKHTFQHTITILPQMHYISNNSYCKMPSQLQQHQFTQAG